MIGRAVYTNLDFNGKVVATIGNIDLRSRGDLEALYKRSLQVLLEENAGARIFLTGEACPASNLAVLFGVNVTYLETIKQLLIEDGIRCKSLRHERL